MIIFLTLAASIAALAGGLLALRLKDNLHLVLGFSAGAIVGAALFDLIPEAVEAGQRIGWDVGTMTALTALGFLIYLILDRLYLGHTHSHAHESAQARGHIGGASLSVHSLIDGAAIGLAFQASAAIGLVVSLAVIAHRFSDGINTVGLIFKNQGSRRQALGWLIGVAAAPAAGAIAAFVFHIPEGALGPVLAIFAGFFLYIGASDLIPEGHHGHPTFLTTAMTVAGAATLYAIVYLAHI